MSASWISGGGGALNPMTGDFLGGPVVKTPHFHCRGCGCDSWSGTKILHALRRGQRFFKKCGDRCLIMVKKGNSAHRYTGEGLVEMGEEIGGRCPQARDY